MSIENLKALANVGFNGDMQLGLIANSLLNVVGTSGAQRRSALQSIARDVELLSVADIKRRKLSTKVVGLSSITETVIEQPRSVVIKSKSKSKSKSKGKVVKTAPPKVVKAKSNGSASKSASA